MKYSAGPRQIRIWLITTIIIGVITVLSVLFRIVVEQDMELVDVTLLSYALYVLLSTTGTFLGRSYTLTNTFCSIFIIIYLGALEQLLSGVFDWSVNIGIPIVVLYYVMAMITWIVIKTQKPEPLVMNGIITIAVGLLVLGIDTIINFAQDQSLVVTWSPYAAVFLLMYGFTTALEPQKWMTNFETGSTHSRVWAWLTVVLIDALAVITVFDYTPDYNLSWSITFIIPLLLWLYLAGLTTSYSSYRVRGKGVMVAGHILIGVGVFLFGLDLLITFASTDSIGILWSYFAGGPLIIVGIVMIILSNLFAKNGETEIST